jgi:hypothetical protein
MLPLPSHPSFTEGVRAIATGASSRLTRRARHLTHAIRRGILVLWSREAHRPGQRGYSASLD